MTKSKRDEIFPNLGEALFFTHQSLKRTVALFSQRCSGTGQDLQGSQVTPSIYQLQLDCAADRTGSLAWSAGRGEHLPRSSSLHTYFSLVEKQAKCLSRLDRRTSHRRGSGAPARQHGSGGAGTSDHYQLLVQVSRAGMA
jgi:hypothetical protein